MERSNQYCEISEIIPNLCISNMMTAKSIIARRTAVSPPFTHILSIHNGEPQDIQDLTPGWFGGPRSKQIFIPDQSRYNFLEHFPSICRLIHHALRSGGQVLVHCYLGVSRSATAVVAYLMWAGYGSFEEARHLVKRYRPLIDTRNFEEQLRMWERLGYSLVDRQGTVKRAYRDYVRRAGLRSWHRGRRPDVGAARGVRRPVYLQDDEGLGLGSVAGLAVGASALGVLGMGAAACGALALAAFNEFWK